MYSHKLKKWTLARCQNKNFVYNLFRNDLKRIELLEDNEFQDLVVMRKDFFENIYNEKENTDIRLIYEVLKAIENPTDAQAYAINKLKSYAFLSQISSNSK